MPLADILEAELHTEIEQFAARFFEIEPAERNREWRSLALRAARWPRLTIRLADLQPGLDVVFPEPPAKKTEVRQLPVDAEANCPAARTPGLATARGDPPRPVTSIRAFGNAARALALSVDREAFARFDRSPALMEGRNIASSEESKTTVGPGPRVAADQHSFERLASLGSFCRCNRGFASGHYCTNKQSFVNRSLRFATLFAANPKLRAARAGAAAAVRRSIFVRETAEGV